jgi:hypothetical protein
MLYYDVFDVIEEEEYLELEKERCRQELRTLDHRIVTNDSTLKEISLDFPLEREELARLADAICYPSHIVRLRICYWGLGDAGVQELERVLINGSSIHQLALPCCGITSVGVEALLRSMINNNTTGLVKLDLSRNSLRLGRGSLKKTFLELLPKVSCLKELDLAATGLDAASVRSLLVGLETNKMIHTLDISSNFDSLETLLDCIMGHLPRLQYLERLILARGASSSTCIHYSNPEILERLVPYMKENTCMQFLGPLSILPLDRQSCMETQDLHRQCVQSLDTIQFYLERNQFQSLVRGLIHHPLSLLPTALARANATRSSSSTLYYLLLETASCLMADT